jgi:hypothetical protein
MIQKAPTTFINMVWPCFILSGKQGLMKHQGCNQLTNLVRFNVVVSKEVQWNWKDNYITRR